MEEFDRTAVARMPLAEGVGWLSRYVLDDLFLEEIWDEHRGRCWTGMLSFPSMVQLIHDALLNYKSGRESFLKHQRDGRLETSLQAAYGKLSRIPVAVSEALLLRSTETASTLSGLGKLGEAIVIAGISRGDLRRQDNQTGCQTIETLSRSFRRAIGRSCPGRD